MAGNNFRYNLDEIPEYFREYYKAYNEWKDDIADIPDEKYRKQICGKDETTQAWRFQNKLHQKQEIALDKMTDEQVRELIHRVGSMTNMYLAHYLSNRQEKRSGICKITLDNLLYYRRKILKTKLDRNKFDACFWVKGKNGHYTWPTESFDYLLENDWIKLTDKYTVPFEEIYARKLLSSKEEQEDFDNEFSLGMWSVETSSYIPYYSFQEKSLNYALRNGYISISDQGVSLLNTIFCHKHKA